MIMKSDGGFGYGTTDMACIRHRVHEEKGDFIVYVTDLGQAPHFQQIFGAAKKARFLPTDGSVRIEHVGFGVVLNEEGTRIKSRAGNVSPSQELQNSMFLTCSTVSWPGLCYCKTLLLPFSCCLAYISFKGPCSSISEQIVFTIQLLSYSGLATTL